MTSSGNNPKPNYANGGHAEAHAARATQTGGIIYHNNTNGTCGWCNTMLSTQLPLGARMRVVPPSDAKANNSRAVDRPKTYEGNENSEK